MGGSHMRRCEENGQRIGIVPLRTAALHSDGSTVYLGGRTLIALDKVTHFQTEILGPLRGSLQIITAIHSTTQALYLDYSGGSLVRLEKATGAVLELRSTRAVHDGARIALVGPEPSVPMPPDVSFVFAPATPVEVLDADFSYFGSQSEIWRASRRDQVPEVLVAEVAGSRVGDLTLAGEFIYYSLSQNFVPISVMRVRKDGTSRETLATWRDDSTFAFAVLPKAVYWTSEKGAVHKVPLDRDPPRAAALVAQRDAFDEDDWNALITADASTVYWVASHHPTGTPDDDDPLAVFATCAD
jgi:hypothetical protein